MTASKYKGFRIGAFYCLGLLMWTGRLFGPAALEYEVCKVRPKWGGAHYGRVDLLRPNLLVRLRVAVEVVVEVQEPLTQVIRCDVRISASLRKVEGDLEANDGIAIGEQYSSIQMVRPSIARAGGERNQDDGCQDSREDLFLHNNPPYCMNDTESLMRSVDYITKTRAIMDFIGPPSYADTRLYSSIRLVYVM